MKILNFKKFFWLASLLAVAIFSFQLALAESDIPENLVPLAEELGCQTKEECARAFDSNFEKGIELAEKHNVYNKEQSEIAQSYKQEVISKLSNITEENFEEEIVKIAKELLKKPKLAKSFQLDKDTVNAAETIVTEVKNAGVGVDICSQSAETLSREQLIGCLEASKKLAKKSSIVQKYIPRGVIEKTNMADMAASLDEALAKGDYPELGKTAEEAGQKCLKSGSGSLKSCDEIAQKFFGPKGVKELAEARTQAKQAGDFYLKGLENLELVTSDGRKIAGKTAIKNACDKAFETGDVKLARSCGEFAVKNGFTSQKEMDDGLKIFESMADKNINFDQCRSNPELCEEFIPEEHRKEFEGNKKIYEIMKTEAGFDPIECERGNVDFEIGRKCFEASQKALPKLKEIAADYPEVQRMVSEIEFGIKREGEQKQKGDDFDAEFNFRNHSLDFRIICGYFFQLGQGFLGRFKTFPADFKINISSFAFKRIKTRFGFHNFVNFFVALKFFPVFFRNEFFAKFRVASALVKIYVFIRHRFKNLEPIIHFFLTGKAVLDGKFSARPGQLHVSCFKSFFASIFYSRLTRYFSAVGSHELQILQAFQIKISRLLGLSSGRRQFFHPLGAEKFLRDFIARFQRFRAGIQAFLPRLFRRFTQLRIISLGQGLIQAGRHISHICFLNHSSGYIFLDNGAFFCQFFTRFQTTDQLFPGKRLRGLAANIHAHPGIFYFSNDRFGRVYRIFVKLESFGQFRIFQ